MIRIAIDGPGGAGKSTIAKKVAESLNIDYIDTGAMYRAIALKAIKEGVDPDIPLSLENMLKSTSVDFYGGKTILDGEDVSGKIRTEEVSAMASRCSSKAPVREKLVEMQKEMASQRSLIMDGRDIGTNVIKDAEVKIFLTASAEERAKRRYEELTAKGVKAEYDKVLEDINKRDYNDTHRKLNPLKRAEDAILLDTTDMTIDEVATYILKEAKKYGDC